MATETVSKANPMETTTETKALTPKRGGPEHTLIKPGEVRNPKGGASAKHAQMSLFREWLLEIDPQYDTPRLGVVFTKMYELATGRGVVMVPTTEGEENRTGIKYRARPVTGKDMVAAAEFLMERSFGTPKDIDLENAGSVRVEIIGIPGGSKVGIGVQTPISPEFTDTQDE